ncbi:YesL family protein [Gracilibacillus phocaeensis]|uniref:YesL family protein n=1 Tax=Gracilibacillus phocaeensis TaxID=2042304 RepID=UPI00103229D8|nr:DUF624 domain-containing protein [Gracilibacillus phocaeensis]
MLFDISGGLFKLCEWLYRLVILQILAIMFTLAGAIIFGIFPSIMAMFALNKKWIEKEDDFPILKMFWKQFKQYFVKSNVLGIAVIITGMALYIDFAIVQNFSGWLYYVILSSSTTVLILALVILLYVFGLTVNFPLLKINHLIKRALQVSTLFPLLTMWMGVSLIGFLFICLVIPGIGFLFMGSGLSFIAMYFCQHTLNILQHLNDSTMEKRGVIYGK